MVKTRNRQWRRHHAKRVFKARLSVVGACMLERKLWFEIAGEKWTRPYKTTGTPCSCWMCRGESFDRKAAKGKPDRWWRNFLKKNCKKFSFDKTCQKPPVPLQKFKT